MTDPTQPAAAPDDSVDASWPAELDALIAAPAHHTLLFENDQVRVLDTRITPGDRTPVHTHRWPAALYIQSWSAFVRYDPEGNVLVDSRENPALSAPGPVLWSAPLPPHALENIGAADMHVISFEVKNTPR